MRSLFGLLTLLALLLWARGAVAAIERFAVIIGNDAGAPGDVELQYAEADAQKVHDVMRGLGGFSPANMVLLKGDDADTARRSIITINDRIRSVIAAPGGQAMLVVYYSGHADAAALHLGPTALQVRELEQLVRGSAATFRMLVVDACRSGALTRVKGGESAPPLAIRLDSRLAGEGVVFWTSSSANEDAQESDVLKGSFFTHHLVSGLLGAADIDHDGRIVLDEAYRYAYEHTLRATSRTWVGTQHPTFVYELRGQGKVVLTTLRTAERTHARVQLPEGRNYFLMQNSSGGAVVAEVGALDKARTVALRPGRYFVRARAEKYLLEGEIEVQAGRSYDIPDAALTRSEYARLVRKGQGEAEVSHGPQAGYRFRTPLWSGASLCHGPFLGYAVDVRHFGVMPRLGVCRGGYDNEHLEATTDELDLELRLVKSWDLPVVTLGVGVGGGVSLLRQTFETRGAAPSRTTLAGEIVASVGLSVDLVWGVSAFADVEAQTYLFEQQSPEDRGQTSTDAFFALRPAFGVGKRW
jgi:hypothetical protein